MTGYRGNSSPVVYGPVGISAAAMCRIKVASGQAAAKARRTRDAISITRAPSFKRRSRIVLNSALASACPFGMASLTVSISHMWTAPASQDCGQIFDRIACDHMSGLCVRSHMTAGQDGFRDASSKQ